MNSLHYSVEVVGRTVQECAERTFCFTCGCFLGMNKTVQEGEKKDNT